MCNIRTRKKVQDGEKWNPEDEEEEMELFMEARKLQTQKDEDKRVANMQKITGYIFMALVLATIALIMIVYFSGR
ncbi:MAG: hypothetical protein KC736_05150 [Candidatus Moranbacteria bacterium]|nr:hypothetical protein [Candidatus Moranbacteria bacterium]